MASILTKEAKQQLNELVEIILANRGSVVDLNKFQRCFFSAVKTLADFQKTHPKETEKAQRELYKLCQMLIQIDQHFYRWINTIHDIHQSVLNQRLVKCIGFVLTQKWFADFTIQTNGGPISIPALLRTTSMKLKSVKFNHKDIVARLFRSICSCHEQADSTDKSLSSVLRVGLTYESPYTALNMAHRIFLLQQHCQSTKKTYTKQFCLALCEVYNQACIELRRGAEPVTTSIHKKQKAGDEFHSFHSISPESLPSPEETIRRAQDKRYLELLQVKLMYVINALEESCGYGIDSFDNTKAMVIPSRPNLRKRKVMRV